MAFIIKKNNPFISTKLTQKGREKLAQGLLTFKYWAIGDSEVNYEREEIFDSIPSNTVTAKVIRSVDKQPNLKYYIYKNNASDKLNVLNSSDIKTLKLTVNNSSIERGFFNNLNALGYEMNLDAKHVIRYGNVNNSQIRGLNTVDMVVNSGASVGDIVMFKFANDIIGPTGNLDANSPLLVLFFEVIAVNGNILTFNRNTPNLRTSSLDSNYIIYPGEEIHETNLWGGDAVSYWNSETLNFDSSCDVSRSDVPVLNLTIVNLETLAGYTSFGDLDSNDYLGVMENYLSYNDSLSNTSNNLSKNDPCSDNLSSGYLDRFVKSIGLVHYTNNTISNFYGDFFHIDIANGKNLKLHVPHIMYHRREKTTDAGLTPGMVFIGNGSLKFIEGSDIEYYDLIEDPDYVVGRTPLVVGKILPQLKTIVFDDQELLMVISQHTNRNFTLPNLKGRLVNSVNGSTNGLLPINKKIYLTYSLNNLLFDTNYVIHNGNYLVIENKSLSSKDVDFNIEDVDLLKYMGDKDDPAYIGLGFTAETFDVFYQITDLDERPLEGYWKKLSFNDNIMGANGSIRPSLLENQNAMFNSQIISKDNDLLSTNYDFMIISGQQPSVKRFGSETFFFGNLITSIGSTIYKTIFDLRINSSEFNKTSNPTRSTTPTNNPPPIRLTEIGIYDNLGELVMIGKTSQPIVLNNGSTTLIELSMDF